jgi:hypothetical protein
MLCQPELKRQQLAQTRKPESQQDPLSTKARLRVRLLRDTVEPSR